MLKRIALISIFLIFYPLYSLFSQVDPDLVGEEIENNIDRALDFFSDGNYEEALRILNEVLKIDSNNSRTHDLIKSINELYKMEIQTDSTEEIETDFIARRPDFTINDPEEKKTEIITDSDGELERPDFSVRDENQDLTHPKEKRTQFELSLAPSILFPWDISEESVVFPTTGGYSGNFSAKFDYFFSSWDRIFGYSAMYSLFLLDWEDDGIASDQLHIFDAMVNFRTYFSETVDTRIIFKLSMGYRGYFANGYYFYDIERDYLSGFNMGVNLEAPLLYLFWDNELFKRFIVDFDMNLLFFPEINTLNLLDFRINGEIRFSNFSMGLHFGSYSVVTTDDIIYLWMGGMNISLFL